MKKVSNAIEIFSNKFLINLANFRASIKNRMNVLPFVKSVPSKIMSALVLEMTLLLSIKQEARTDRKSDYGEFASNLFRLR